jgi:outer membrane protein OmpA-like peptidoglycan-associated protein
MAHLEVEPKPARPWWVWLLTIIILIALAMFLLRKCDAERSDAERAKKADSLNAPIAATGPDWKTVDFNSAAVTDADITDSDIEARGNGTYTIYTLGENILFPSSGNDVSENGQKKLKMISDILSKRFAGATIGVFGSTDSTGPANENKALGNQRAESVKDWLASTGNIPGETISVQSFGETEPVASNDTKAGRKQNRNVSIVVFPKQ